MRSQMPVQQNSLTEEIVKIIVALLIEFVLFGVLNSLLSVFTFLMVHIDWSIYLLTTFIILAAFVFWYIRRIGLHVFFIISAVAIISCVFMFQWLPWCVSEEAYVGVSREGEIRYINREYVVDPDSITTFVAGTDLIAPSTSNNPFICTWVVQDKGIVKGDGSRNKCMFNYETKSSVERELIAVSVMRPYCPIKSSKVFFVATKK